MGGSQIVTFERNEPAAINKYHSTNMNVRNTKSFESFEKSLREHIVFFSLRGSCNFTYLIIRILNSFIWARNTIESIECSKIPNLILTPLWYTIYIQETGEDIAFSENYSFASTAFNDQMQSPIWGTLSRAWKRYDVRIPWLHKDNMVYIQDLIVLT